MEKISVEERKRLVARLFKLEGDDFVYEVLKHHRGTYDAAPPTDVCERVSVVPNELMGRTWYKISANVQPKGKTNKILYLHGGGFVLESGAAQYEFAAYLAEETGAEIWFPEYHLAPEHTCLAALDMVCALYEMMLQDTSADSIAVIGDSAGGTLALSAVMLFRERGLPQPNGVILSSPGVGFEYPTDPAGKAFFAELDARDPLISSESIPTTARLWRGALPESDYRGNPIMGELKGLAPMLVFAGTNEVILIFIRQFVDKAKSEGADIRYIEREGRTHCWVMFPGDNAEDRKIVVDTLLNPQ